MKQITVLGVLLQYPKGALFLKDYKAKNIRNVVFAGHASAGKTSLVEAAYYLTGKSDRLGTIAEGNTVSDFDPEEIRRKSSVSATIVPCEWKDVKINVIDTPGQFDFSASVSEGFRAAGSSVIVISGKSGVSVGAQKAFDAATKKGIAKIGHDFGEAVYAWNGNNCIAIRKCARNENHIEMDGGLFDIRVGCREIGTGELIYPGERINCSCSFSPVIVEYGDDIEKEIEKNSYYKRFARGE